MLEFWEVRHHDFSVTAATKKNRLWIFLLFQEIWNALPEGKHRANIRQTSKSGQHPTSCLESARRTSPGKNLLSIALRRQK
jgi:hypothetical protein